MNRPADTLHSPPDATAAPTLVERIEQDIMFGRLRPRERLVEDDLIERTGATRHAVRQALIDLEARHLVVRIPNRGALVRDWTRAEIAEICQMRDWLHERAVRSIALPAPAPWLRELQRLQAAHAKAVDRGEPMAVHRANSAFHDALFGACGNRYLMQTIQDYAQMSLGYRCHLMTRLDLAREARDEHRQMVDAIRRADGERLVALCVGHTRSARQVYEALQAWG